MKVPGFLLLPAGWAVLVVAIVILPSRGVAAVFVVAGLLVELFGLVLVARYHRLPAGGRE